MSKIFRVRSFARKESNCSISFIRAANIRLISHMIIIETAVQSPEAKAVSGNFKKKNKSVREEK